MTESSACPDAVFTAVDLFAGAGGASRGLRNAGFRVLAAVEADSVACRTYAANHPETLLLRCDVREVEAHDLRTRLGIKRNALALLEACPPCQGFSTLGPSNPRDARNELIHEGKTDDIRGAIDVGRRVLEQLREIQQNLQRSGR